MMKTQACIPCSKRKVRCDRQVPCSNCKRRKQDRCVYAEITPADRIKELEALVQTLRQQIDATPNTRQTQSEQQDGHALNCNVQSSHVGGESSITERQGETIYVESTVFQAWGRNGYGLADDQQAADGGSSPRQPFNTFTGSEALSNMMNPNAEDCFLARHPSPQDAAFLWATFRQRVKPVLQLSFDWELEPLQATATLPGAERNFSAKEHLFIFALYFVTVTSLSDEECLQSLHHPRAYLRSECQGLSEQALIKAGFPGHLDIMSLQALTMYIVAGTEFISNQSLWALMGIIVRNAERLGVHRDGAALNLPPAETERRRRLWWQLQHVDLLLSVFSGTTSLTFAADWDAALPLNIEDSDVSPDSKEAPTERKGITSMSSCLWTYYVILEQRSFRRADGSRQGISWLSSRALSWKVKEAFFDRLESSLNNLFIKFCDPLRQLDNYVQLHIRAYLCGMRRILLHFTIQFMDKSSERTEFETELFNVSVKCLEYAMAMSTCPSAKPFLWRFEPAFPWTSLVLIIAECHRLLDAPKAEHLWNLLNNVYSACPGLYDLPTDRRKSSAARLVMKAWEAREAAILEQNQQQSNLFRSQRKPHFVETLEGKLSGRNIDRSHSNESNNQEYINQMQVLPDQLDMSLFDVEAFMGSSFNEIDWSFWTSIE